MWPELWAYGIAELGHSLVRPKELEAEATNETYAEVGHRAGERADMQSEDHSPITITKPHQPHYHYWVPIGVRAEEGVGQSQAWRSLDKDFGGCVLPRVQRELLSIKCQNIRSPANSATTPLALHVHTPSSPTWPSS